MNSSAYCCKRIYTTKQNTSTLMWQLNLFEGEALVTSYQSTQILRCFKCELHDERAQEVLAISKGKVTKGSIPRIF